MCNLYNVTTSRQAVLQFTRAMRDEAGYNEPSIDIYPNSRAPVVRNAADGERELAMLNWGMPTPPQFVKGNADRGVTNIRNVASPHWRSWLGVESRCVVPVTSFAEPSPVPNDKDPETNRQRNIWFALDETRPLFFFAGFWTPWHGVKRVRDGAQDFELYGILTCKPNAVVAAIHPKAMPVVLTEQEEIELWLTAPWEDAQALQMPLPDDMLIKVDKPAVPESDPQPVQGSLL